MATGMGWTQILNKGISHVTAVAVHNVGERCYYDGAEYVYICNRSSDKTAQVGHAMHLSANTGYSAVITAATDTTKPIGVVKHVDIPVAEYGWIVTRGRAPAFAGLNTGIAAGDLCIMVGTSNTGNISRKTDNTVQGSLVFAVCIQATATAGQAEIYIW